MKIRCSDCTKKISIDDAFAGGVCRCPYCSALVFVPEGGEPAAGGPRPSAPGEAAAPARPQSPAEMEAVAKARGQEHIPVASPVKIQGIVSMVLLGLLLMMFIGGVALYLVYGRKTTKPIEQSEESMNPFTMKVSPGVAGNIRLNGPVVYLADCGYSMSEAKDYVFQMVLKSINSLGDQQFTVLLACENAPKSFGELKPGSSLNEEALGRFFEEPAQGSADVPLAFQSALALKPATIVLFTAKMVETVDNLVAKAKESGVMVHGILVAPQPDGGKSTPEMDAMEKLTKGTGGKFRRYSRRALDQHVNP